MSVAAFVIGGLAAPSAASVVVNTLNLNFSSNVTGSRNITIGGNATPQYFYSVTAAGNTQGGVDYEVSFGSYTGAFYGPTTPFGGEFGLQGPFELPALGVANTSGDFFVGQSPNYSKFPTETLVPLQFEVSGATNVGNVYFNQYFDLTKIDYGIPASLGPVAPVPEPEIWAQLVAGFAVAGAAVRRRRRQAALAA